MRTYLEYIILNHCGNANWVDESRTELKANLESNFVMDAAQFRGGPKINHNIPIFNEIAGPTPGLAISLSSAFMAGIASRHRGELLQ